MAKVRVDEELCTGHGRCYSLGPEVFEADEMGHCVVVRPDVSGDLIEKAKLGESSCPESAIAVED